MTAKRCGGGLLKMIRDISEEDPISNIKDESDRFEDDPDRSEGIRQ